MSVKSLNSWQIILPHYSLQKYIMINWILSYVNPENLAYLEWPRVCALRSIKWHEILFWGIMVTLKVAFAKHCCQESILSFILGRRGEAVIAFQQKKIKNLRVTYVEKKFNNSDLLRFFCILIVPSVHYWIVFCGPEFKFSLWTKMFCFINSVTPHLSLSFVSRAVALITCRIHALPR